MNAVPSCHICKGQLDEFKNFSDLYQVTSDCRPWRKDGHLCICQKCGIVQKPVTRQWKRDAEDIYNCYEMYKQAGGLEQSIFDQSSGANEVRSRKIVSWLFDIGLPQTGTLLDIGCGNGAFLKAFSYVYPNYELAGLELDEKNKDELESINGVKKLYIGNVDVLDKCFDVIVMVHALEHIPDPVKYLISISKKLKEGGYLFVEVPHLEKSPFDILIADHCTHFDLESIRKVAQKSGYEPVKTASDYIPKELSLFFKWSGDQNGQKIGIFFDGSKNLKKRKLSVNENILWLLKFINEGERLSGEVGIFGTSISATWLATSLGNKVSFFVDEDVNRIGRTHLGKPIYSPNNIQMDSTNNILMPLREDIASKICKRYETLNFITLY